MKLTPMAALGLACAEVGPAAAEFDELAIPLVLRLEGGCEPMECLQPRQAAPRQPAVIHRELLVPRPQLSPVERTRRAAEGQAEINDS